MYDNDSLESLCKASSLSTKSKKEGWLQTKGIFNNLNLNLRNVIDFDNLNAASITHWIRLCDEATNNGDNDACLYTILPSLTELYK